MDFRTGIDGLAAVGWQGLGVHPLEGAVYVCRTRTGTALKLLLDDGQGYGRCLKRFSQGRLTWWPTTLDARGPLAAREGLMLLGHGAPERAQRARAWHRVASGAARLGLEAQGTPAAGGAQPSCRCSCSAPRDATAWTSA